MAKQGAWTKEMDDRLRAYVPLLYLPSQPQPNGI